MDEALLLTPVQAAHALGISRSSLYELLLPRALRSVLIGRSRRIPGTALIDFIAALEAADSRA